MCMHVYMCEGAIRQIVHRIIQIWLVFEILPVVHEDSERDSAGQGKKICHK